MDWSLGNIYYLIFLLLIPILAVLIFRYLKWRSRKREIFAESRFRDFLFAKDNAFSKFFSVLYLLAAFFLILSIVDFLKGSEEVESQQKVNSIIFLLDISNSMNAEDVQPNRLTEAKNIVINTLEKLKNDRVGMVVFAGEAVSVMPLTTDYSAASTYLQGIETSAMKVQGTDFLKGISMAAEKFKNISPGSRKVVLISDGEDNEGNENAAIKEAKNQGIKIISVGVGTEEGAPIPEYIYGQLMGYKVDLDGKDVITQRQTAALKNIAESTGGDYIDGNQLEPAVNEIINQLQAQNSGSTTMVKTQNGIHYYQYLLAISIFFFVLIWLINPKKDFNI